MFAPIMVLGTVQTATRPKALWVGGVDVIKQSTYAVPIESVSISHVGPGGVSSMTFSVECTTVPPAISIADGMDVRFFNTTKGWYDFSGFVDHVDVVNLQGNRGTVYHVQCTGYEAILDWAVIASDLVVPAGLACDAAAQSVFGSATGTSLGRLNALASGSENSLEATPVASNVTGPFTATVGVAFTVTAGTTLREALRQVTASLVLSGGSDSTFVWRITVDFLGGLRFYADRLNAGVWASPTDWGNFGTVDNDTPGTQPGGNTTYGIDAAQTRGVVVKGTGVSVFVPDGSGKEGPIAVLSDTTITTAAAALTAGNAYLAQYATTARGSFDWQDRPTAGTGPGNHGNPGAIIIVTDARLGLSGTFFPMTQVDKTYNPSGRENWVVSFGGPAPSVTDLTRQLTRNTLS